jgi:hypothetical protein
MIYCLVCGMPRTSLVLSFIAQVAILRLLRLLGKGDAESLEAMSDTLAQVRDADDGVLCVLLLLSFFAPVLERMRLRGS